MYFRYVKTANSVVLDYAVSIQVLIFCLKFCKYFFLRCSRSFGRVEGRGGWMQGITNESSF
jgi:hypothetical protein